MDTFDLYKDIQCRTNGETIWVVVGPVRSGKSTFIKRFMDVLVLPKMTDEHAKERTVDELPQSASGKSIMTTEPKFVPKEAARNPARKGCECAGASDRLCGLYGGGSRRSHGKWSRTSGENAVERKRNSVYKGRLKIGRKR